MRAWDNWNSYLDNDGNLLHGKIRFCRKGTTDDIVIYNSDGTPIRNPEFTDMLGRTEYQVFVDNDADVTAYFYKYVGNGDMMGTDPEDYDPSRWAYQYSSDSLDPVVTVDLTSDTANGVGTVSDLRATDPADVPSVDGVKLLWVYGYYAAGDTSPVLYVWDSACTHSDDGGAYIQPTAVPGNGRWVLATRELHFDVRHYGVFPTEDIYSTDIQYTSQMANCAAYLNDEGLDAWFPALNGNLSYYLFSGTNTFSIRGDIYVSDAVRMHCLSGTTGTAISCRELHKPTPLLFVSSQQTGLATLTADWINISWVGGQVTGNARVGWVIDSDDFARTITGKEVKFVTNGNPSLQLDNCLVTSHKAITGDIVMSNMALHTDWFADGYSWGDLSLYNCTINIDDCSSADLYVTLKNKMQQADYGSFREQTVTGGTFLDGAVVEDASLSGCTFQGDAEIRNVSGTVTFAAASEINGVDCWLTVSNASTAVLDKLVLNRGSVYGTAIQVLSVLRMEGVDISASISATGANVFLADCTINSAMSHVMDSLVKEEIRGCTFNAQLTVSGGSADTAVHAAWVGNYGTVADPVTFDRTNLKAVDAEHSYVYRDNSGTFEVTTYETFTVSPLNYTPGTPALLTTTRGAPAGGVYGWTETDDPSKYLCTVRLFSVGTVGVRKRFEALPQSPINKTAGGDIHLTGGIVYGSTVDHVNESGVVSTLLFSSGFTWKVRNLAFAGVSYPDEGLQFTAYFREVQ